MKTLIHPFRIGAMALLLGAAACSSAPRQDQAPAAEKRASGTAPAADILLADAMQRQSATHDAAQALPLVALAAQKAPDRPEVAWLHSRLCMQVAGCQPEPVESRLRQLDPGNAAAWSGALARAQQQRDVAAENEILDAMSRGQRFDLYWNRLISTVAGVESVATTTRLSAASPDLLTANLNQAIGWLSETAVPAFRPVTESCSAVRLANPATAQRCRALGEVLMKGDTYIAQSVGLGIAERLAAPDSPQSAAVAAQIRLLRYQRDTAGAIVNAQIDREKFSREMIKLMRSLKREQDVFLAVIRWAGQPVAPPQG